MINQFLIYIIMFTSIIFFIIQTFMMYYGKATIKESSYFYNKTQSEIKRFCVYLLIILFVVLIMIISVFLLILFTNFI